MDEQWKQIAGYPNYQVSNLGRVRSIARKNSIIKQPRKHPTTGYLTTAIYKNGKGTTFTIQRLVMEAFVGKRPEGMQVRHLDGDPENNRLTNLTYGTC